LAKYTVALSKGWSDLEKLTQEKKYSLRFLADEYEVDLESRRILSVSPNAPAKDYLSIILLHFLIQKLKGLPRPTGEWLSFKQLSGGQGYFPTFKKRVIDVIVRKYSPKPEELFKLTERLDAKRAQHGDISIIIEVLEQLPVLITFWRGDDEFGPEANILFDQNINNIFCTEDVVVLAEALVYNI